MDSPQGIDNKSGSIYKKTFSRAARCLRKALGVEGVLFADGLVGLHGGLLPGNEPIWELEREVAKTPDDYQTEDAHTSGTADGVRDRDTAMNPVKNPASDATDSGTGMHSAKRTFTSANFQKSDETKRTAEILGFLLRANQSLAQRDQFAEDMSAFAGLNEDLLQQFLERHTEGKIFYFDTEGDPFRSEQGALVPDEDAHEDASMLYSLFPGTRQLIFSPLTDVVTQKRLAGCFAWSTRHFPVFTEEADLGPFKTFLYSVEAEISRVDTVAAVKQQEAFVSSVSHELRSPLHGILGAVELLGDTNIDSFQQDLANTIRLCGTALHETLSSVLAYAKINEFERKQNRRPHQIKQESAWALGDAKAYRRARDVASLCEDIVEVVGTRHPLGTSTNDHSKRSKGGTDDPITSLPITPMRKGSGLDDASILTLNVAYNQNWKFMTEPGALRRVKMNIIGNALKYSPRGFVKVFLEIDQMDEGKREADDKSLPVQNVAFTVRDSGKGMSKDFLDNRLFLPFAQEDAIASPGVGLGMSIVKSLVSLLGGRIEVESQVGEGTKIKVLLPMTASRSEYPGTSPNRSKLEQDVLTLQHKRLNVAMLCSAPTVGESLQAYLTGWCSCNVLPVHDKTSNVDVVVVHQGRLQTFEEIHNKLEVYDPTIPTLIISSSMPSLKEAQVSSQGYRNFHRISQPFGPNKIAKALVTCIEKTEVVQRPMHHVPKAESRNLDSATTSVVSATQPSDSFGAREVQISGSDGGTGKPPSTKGTHPGASSTAASPWLEKSTSGTRSDVDTLSLNHKRSTQPLHSASNTNLVSPSVPNGTADEGDHHSPRLLLIDDNAINLKLLKTFLQKIGYHDIETAANGQLAVQATENRAEGFEIIFMNISMPVMDGLEATRAIRRLEHDRFVSSSPAFPAPSPALVVALTGLASTNEQKESFRSGVDSFITKPVRFESLKKLFDQWKSRKLLSNANGTERGGGKDVLETG